MPDSSLDSIPLKLNFVDDKYLFNPLHTTSNQVSKIISTKNKIVLKKEILKKDGVGKRLIQYPVGNYKRILKLLNKLLMQRSNFPPEICGGIVSKDLSDMVNPHCGQEAIYQIDLKDFFPNISSNRIYTFFLNTGCHHNIAEILTELVSFEGKLPQGFPTSTVIANLIAWKMDFDHSNICKRSNLKRTRWIDDIIVSGRIKDLILVINKIDQSIKKNGFIINPKKQNFVRRKDLNKVMIAVGLDIRKHKPDIPTNVYKHIESILSSCLQYGVRETKNIFEDDLKGKDIQLSLNGKVRFIAQYNERKALDLEQLYTQINWSS